MSRSKAIGTAERLCACGCGERPKNWKALYVRGHRPARRPVVRLFERLAISDADECWEWQGYCKASGHGQIGAEPGGRRGATLLTHRVAWEFFNGRPVSPGMQVNHHCDNPPCCNPRHLYEGTPQQNVNDMKNRGRVALGSMLPQARLSESDVSRIRTTYVREYAQYRTGIHQHLMWRSNARELAAEYGVSQQHIFDIVTGRERKHV